MSTALTTTTPASLLPVQAVQGAIDSPRISSMTEPVAYLALELAGHSLVNLRADETENIVWETAAQALLYKYPGMRAGDVKAAFFLMSAGLLPTVPKTYGQKITPAEIRGIFEEYYASEINRAARDSMPDPRVSLPTAEETLAKLEGEYRVQLEMCRAQVSVEKQIAAHLEEVTRAYEAEEITPQQAGRLRDEYAAELEAYRIKHHWPTTWGSFSVAECSYLIRTYQDVFMPFWLAAKEQAQGVTVAQMEAAHEGMFLKFQWESEKARAADLGKSVASLVAVKLTMWNYLQSLLK